MTPLDSNPSLQVLFYAKKSFLKLTKNYPFKGGGKYDLGKNDERLSVNLNKPKKKTNCIR